MKDESVVQQEIQMEAMKYACTLMRNNSGACVDQTGRMIRYGLGHTSPKQEFKSSDLIGITEVIVTPDMVGKKIGVFTAIEVKKESWDCQKKLDDHERKQNNFLEWVKSKGGIASFANSIDNLKDIFRK